jgi:hypothetical protein
VWALPLGASPASTHISGEGQVAQQDGSPSSSSQPSAASLAALSADGSKLCAGAGGKGASCQAVASLLPAGADAAQAKLLPGSCGSHAVLQAAGGAAVLALDGSGGASAAAFLPGATASGCFPGHDGTPLVAFATPDAAGLRLQVWSAADGSMLQQQEAVAGLAPRLVGGEAVGVAALFAAAAPAAGTLRYACRKHAPAGSRQALPSCRACPCGCSAVAAAPAVPPAGSWWCLRTTAWRW